MSKKIKNLKWESVAVEGFPVCPQNFEGFVGLEECTNYGLDREKKPRKKNEPKKTKSKIKTPENNNVKENAQTKLPAKRKSPIIEKTTEKPNKKVKLDNGFIVESCNNSTAPSQTNEVTIDSKKHKKNSKEHREPEMKPTKTLKNTKVQKTKLGEDIGQTTEALTPEDMLTWAEFKLQDSIMKALTELGFKKPTKIQQLTLPAAIHGRRDILGAAETGSGKTLAFGLPILSGILKLKEKAAVKGLDVYDIPYKKTANKKTEKQEPKPAKNANNSKNTNRKAKVTKNKESSEDGYSSDNENTKADKKSNRKAKIKEILKSNEDDFLEEIDVPIRKRNDDDDEYENDSDDSENYIHLSEMLDSDDLADSSSDDDENDDQNESDCDESISNDEETLSGDEMDDEPESGVEDDSEMIDDESDDVGDENANIGCVKVIDNVEIPGHVVTKTGKPLYALILTPTRELAIQISRHLVAAAKYTGIRIATIVGGMAAVKQERLLRAGPEVVVATPGRLWELLSQGQPHLQQMDTVKFLAIDETDRMVERGHFEELYPLMERLNVDLERTRSRQNFVFSATLTLVHDLPQHLKGKKVTKRGKIINRKIAKMTSQQKIQRLVKMIGMTEPKVVDITAQNLGTSESLTECRIACSLEHKDSYLYYILKRHPGRTIVFCNSIGSVRRLAQLLTTLKCNPLPLHANMPQRQRLKNLERFRDAAHGVLVATDVAARGLDVPGVDHVVQYQVPRTAENYVHRSGRTARAEKEGLNVLMVEPDEAYLYSKLCHTLNKSKEVPSFPVAAHLLAPLRALVSLARELDALELRRRRAAHAQGWRDRAARELDIIVDDDDVPVPKSDPSLERAVKAKRRQLDAMLSRPLFPKGFSFKYPTLNDPHALDNLDENALQVMKKSLETGELKKEKRKSKNASLLKLGKEMRNKNAKI